MSCNYPMSAYRIADREGKPVGIVFAVKGGMNVIQEFRVPCGQCDGCRLERSRQWAIRCLHEASLYDENCFITLTYNDDHLPDRNELVYDDFQKFMKRLRKKMGYNLPTRKHQGPWRKIRFFMCGEYGEKGDRPHFHACIFNLRFPDLVPFKKTPAGSQLYTSAALDSLWSDRSGNPLGFASVGELTFESAGYTARYIMKKGRHSDFHYEDIDYETGEVYSREREFTQMSLKPGIGSGFYSRWKSDIYPHDHCVVNGKAMKPPRYYSKRLKVEDPELYEELQFNRSQKALEKSADNTLERLEVKEKVLKAKVKFFLKRDSI